ncbi:unnamed protein product [Leuciscus chuanchicus]
MVSGFPLDYMHLVCLGVMRRLLHLWLKLGPLTCRLSGFHINTLSERLVNARRYVPMEFARKPRALREIDRWKATEFRQFLLYTGPVMMKDLLTTEVYKNFMLLFVGIFILCNNSFIEDYGEQIIHQWRANNEEDRVENLLQGLHHERRPGTELVRERRQAGNKVIKPSAMRNPVLLSPTEAEAEKYIKDFLRLAPGRVLSRVFATNYRTRRSRTTFLHVVIVISSLSLRYQCFVGTTELASKTNQARQNGSGLHRWEEFRM